MNPCRWNLASGATRPPTYFQPLQGHGPLPSSLLVLAGAFLGNSSVRCSFLHSHDLCSSFRVFPASSFISGVQCPCLGFWPWSLSGLLSEFLLWSDAMSASGFMPVLDGRGSLFIARHVRAPFLFAMLPFTTWAHTHGHLVNLRMFGILYSVC